MIHEIQIFIYADEVKEIIKKAALSGLDVGKSFDPDTAKVDLVDTGLGVFRATVSITI